MPVAALPPQQLLNPPAHHAPAPECHYLNASEAQLAFSRLKQRLPGTPFVEASPSEICGLVRVKMASGKSAYTDATGRYFLLTFALDTHKGSPADNDETINREAEQRQQFPSEAIPGVIPSK